MEVGTKIKELRTMKGLSAKDLADRSEFLTHQTIYDYESGKSLPPLDKLKILSEIFEVDMSYFFGESQKNKGTNWKEVAFAKLEEHLKKAESENEKLWALVEKLTNAKLGGGNFPKSPSAVSACKPKGLQVYLGDQLRKAA